MGYSNSRKTNSWGENWLVSSSSRPSLSALRMRRVGRLGRRLGFGRENAFDDGLKGVAPAPGIHGIAATEAGYELTGLLEVDPPFERFVIAGECSATLSSGSK